MADRPTRPDKALHEPRSGRCDHHGNERDPNLTSLLAVHSYFRYDTPVAVSKVSLSIDEDVLAEARERAGRRELSSYVNEALRRQLQRDRLADLLAEMDAESGPVPDDVMEEARQLWRSTPAGKRRRSA